MNRGMSSITAFGCLGLLGVAACPHQADPVSPPVVAAPGTVAPPGADVPPSASTDTGPALPAQPIAGPAASAQSAPPPIINPPDMSAAQEYPASALYDTFSSPAARAKII